jgi:hypothetical protein
MTKTFIEGLLLLHAAGFTAARPESRPGLGQIAIAGTVIKHAQKSRIGIRRMQNLVGLA